MWPTGASRNQGKSEKGKKCSPSAVRSHRPCLEMLVTSIAEVVAPGIDNLLIVLIYESLRLRQAAFGSDCDCRQVQLWAPTKTRLRRPRSRHGYVHEPLRARRSRGDSHPSDVRWG